MSDASEKPLSGNPNAPPMLYGQYFIEKVYLAGVLIDTIFFGIVIILFFQCMGALLNPITRTRRGIKWGLVAHTVAMFSISMVNTGIGLNLYSIYFVDDRDFSGDGFYSGPFGYQAFITSKAISVIPNAMFFLNTFLADGFLLYRCYVVYAMKFWVIAFPCLMYLVSVALSVILTYYQALDSVDNYDFAVTRFGIPYYLISLSLNILLTLMIATYLIRHNRNIRKQIGLTTDNGLYNTVVTVLVESCVLYAVGSLLVVVPLGAQSPLQAIFGWSFGNVQIISLYLVTLRIANRTAVTSRVITSRKVISMRFRSPEEMTEDDGASHDEYLVSYTESIGEDSSESDTGTRISSRKFHVDH